MIKVFEVWTINKAGDALELGTSYYHDLPSFRIASEQVTFAKGVGLPGKVWLEESPVIFPDLSDAKRFVRYEEAEAAGLKSGLGIPLVENGQLKAVVVLLCSSGVLEIWRPDPTRSYLHLADGAYHGWEPFGAVSRSVTFDRGVGLPGKVWETGVPVILDDLGDVRRFVRYEAAIAAGLTTGLGIPIFNYSRLEAIIVLLSADAEPLSRVFEIWSPDANGLALTLQQSHAINNADLSDAISEQMSDVGAAIPSAVWQEGVPMIWQALSEPSVFIRSEAAGRSGLNAGLGLPVLANGKVKATIVILS